MGVYCSFIKNLESMTQNTGIASFDVNEKTFESKGELFKMVKRQGHSGACLTFLCRDILQSLLSTIRTLQSMQRAWKCPT